MNVSWQVASNLFSKALALIYLIAFVSFAVQGDALIGSRGILPIDTFLGAVWNQSGNRAFWDAPGAFWWWHTDFAVAAIPWVCAALSIAAALIPPHGILQRMLFALLWFGYLSLVGAGQVFMGYQWDYLLLEAGFLAIFLTPDPFRVWLFQWLLFRLMFESGVVKLTSHDLTWRNLTALTYHYETQPLPTALAWFAAHAPLWFQKISCAAVFVVELGVPLLIFGPRRLKQIAAAAFILLQLFILATGSYTFFNLLTIALCLFLLDDRCFRRPNAPVRSNRLVTALLFAFILLLSAASFANLFRVSIPAPLALAENHVEPFGIVNTYGLFATMTTERIEIEVQGSNDGITWQSYEFRYKPGDLKRAPVTAEPFQPRLDWQMWFAALGSYRENPWFQQFMLRLLESSPPVLRLLQRDPFNGRPPRYIRALAYQYRFSDWRTLRATGQWWVREPKGLYFPVVSLR